MVPPRGPVRIACPEQSVAKPKGALREREFDVDVPPQVVHEKALILVVQHGPHDVFVPEVFGTQQFPDFLRALGREDAPENAPGLIARTGC